MTNVQIEAGDLLASAPARQISGLLLPFGETGRTNLGRVKVAPNAVTLPADPSVVTLNTDHQRNQPVGRAIDLHATSAGVRATFTVAKTPEGDDLLAEVAAGKRTKLSAEVTGLVIRAGQIVAGRLYGAAAVEAGAFPSASLLAADVGEGYSDKVTTDETTVVESPDGTTTITEHTESEYEYQPADADPAEDDEEENDDMPAASAPADLAARARTKPRALQIDHIGDLFAAIAQGHRNRDTDLLAALSDITSASHTPNVTAPQWVGELWEGVGYERQYIPLFNHADLTSWEVAGWRWLVKPEVAKYSGNKTDVPSNQPTTEPVAIEAERIAGAHDIDRKYRDFGDLGFIESYYRAMTESYAEVSDVDVLDQVLAELTPTPVGTLPAGVPTGLVAIVRGYMKVLRATRRRPTFALVSDTHFEEILFTSATDVTPYLEKLLGQPGGFEDGFIRPTVDLAPDQVLVGVKDAVTVHELGGGTPIRVEALDIAKGGDDHGVFGYTAVNIHRESGLALVDTDS